MKPSAFIFIMKKIQSRRLNPKFLFSSLSIRKSASSLAALFILAVISPGILKSHLYGSTNNAGAWEVIDVPTTEPMDYATYRLGFRLYSGGGVMTRATFGVFRNVNIGFGWDVKNIIGVNDVELVPPTMHIKIRFYEGDGRFPSIAIGYDGQGYHWDKQDQIYLEKEKGIYLVIEREIFFPDFELTLGCNVNDFKKSTVYGFAAAQYNIERVTILAEYDNLYLEEFQRLNAGLRIEVTPDLNFEFAARNIGRNYSAERIIKANYITRF